MAKAFEMYNNACLSRNTKCIRVHVSRCPKHYIALSTKHNALLPSPPAPLADQSLLIHAVK